MHQIVPGGGGDFVAYIIRASRLLDGDESGSLLRRAAIGHEVLEAWLAADPTNVAAVGDTEIITRSCGVMMVGCR